MSSDSSKVSNALGGKSARACDSCLVKRARWFCAADDAFLCQSCDASVHSANQLASRHDRVRLDKTSNASPPANAPAWQQGFTTRKARTPRHGKPTTKRLLHEYPPANQLLPPVPEIDAHEDPFAEEDNEGGQFLLYRVPVFDPFGQDFFNEEDANNMLPEHEDDAEGCLDLNLAELLGSCDEDLFAADVDSLLIDEEDCSNINIGLFDHQDDQNKGIIINDEFVDGAKRMKVEDDVIAACNNYEAGEKTKSEEEDMSSRSESHNNNNMFLRLNYEAVIAAWATKGCPWTNGTPPQFDNLDQFMDEWSGGSSEWCGGRIGGNNNNNNNNNNDAEREARVLRYKEKRRTRLFSKKIRYQVRKLNAENRPRMKGRFVKRPTAFSASNNSLPYNLLHQ
ncbi:hypothetical protein ABFS82_09G051900 [Erythranthe guttata]|uniref:CCT domain-containing protein n=1 Tax=Erythranthe guttata TaxID=4155 RepID=A0A022RZN6_ERYGU|nr:PREDICTED: zinc finger protein CONSTANS-LIKE 16-like [Erythranthe guttata]EYU45446.1 hypothetical protein MIMGU_mgv1a026677mg [Erythranthe guttata]|eukprot:XP_012842560.1 PREDICTED: zinc finger protein CONSTANS-LIKE 16-like [Erythranthe guttata]